MALAPDDRRSDRPPVCQIRAEVPVAVAPTPETDQVRAMITAGERLPLKGSQCGFESHRGHQCDVSGHRGYLNLRYVG